MKLSELATACRVYGEKFGYDESYAKFRETVGTNADMTRAEHRHALLTWLNKWGCRQFARKYHEKASEEILAWHEEYGRLLPARGKNLWDLAERELDSCAEAYAALSARTASYRKGVVRVSFGFTGAAKIMFAVRPKAVPPWDKAIRSELKQDGSARAYRDYLVYVRGMIWELKEECQRKGFGLVDLPEKLGRPLSSVAKMIDEYHWIKFTQGRVKPARAFLSGVKA